MRSLGFGKRHVPDLPQLHRVCETNYMALMKLLPLGAWPAPGREFAVGDSLQFHLRLLEESRYTSLIEITQGNADWPDYLRAYLQVRLYHDARMAEVCVSQQIERLQPSYDYPNPQMHHRDEKEQWNLFLAEWLKFCLAHGYARVEFIRP